METVITKIVTTEYIIQQVNAEDGIVIDFTKFKNTRLRYGLGFGKKESECLRCDKKFKDGDRMYMVITDKGNYFVCKECAKILRKEMNVSDYCKPENQNNNGTD